MCFREVKLSHRLVINHSTKCPLSQAQQTRDLELLLLIDQHQTNIGSKTRGGWKCSSNS